MGGVKADPVGGSAGQERPESAHCGRRRSEGRFYQGAGDPVSGRSFRPQALSWSEVASDCLTQFSFPHISPRPGGNRTSVAD